MQILQKVQLLFHIFVFFLVSSVVFLWTLPQKLFLPNLFLNINSWTLSFSEAGEAFGSGFFCDLLVGSMLDYSTFGTLLGKFPTVTSFLHLWIMTITVVHHSPKALYCLCNAFQADRRQWLCFSSVLLGIESDWDALAWP